MKTVAKFEEEMASISEWTWNMKNQVKSRSIFKNGELTDEDMREQEIWIGDVKVCNILNCQSQIFYVFGALVLTIVGLWYILAFIAIISFLV